MTLIWNCKEKKNIIDMASSINAFKCKLQLLMSELKKQNCKNFPTLELQRSQQHFETYEEEINKIFIEFERRFQDLQKIQVVLTFLPYPFNCPDIQGVSSCIANTFHIHMELCTVENKVLKLISDISLRARAADNTHLSSMPEQKCPLLKQVSLQITAKQSSQNIVPASQTSTW